MKTLVDDCVRCDNKGVECVRIDYDHILCIQCLEETHNPLAPDELALSVTVVADTYETAFRSGDLDAFAALFSDEVIWHGNSAWRCDRRGIVWRHDHLFARGELQTICVKRVSFVCKFTVDNRSGYDDICYFDYVVSDGLIRKMLSYQDTSSQEYMLGLAKLLDS